MSPTLGWQDSIGSYMNAHHRVLLILLNELGKQDKMRATGLQSVLSLYRKRFNKFNKT